MVAIPINPSDYRRTVAGEPELKIQNRYFEENPTNQQNQVGLLARPVLRKLVEKGEGPIRGIYNQPGAFDDALFWIGHDTLYRLDTDGTITTIGSGIYGSGLRTRVRFAATGNIGATPEYLFITGGRSLYVYTDDSLAEGTLTASGAIADGDEIEIDSIHYRWTTGDVDSGSPDGSSSDPWLVALGADNEAALANVLDAINADGTAGTTYSTDLTEHSTVRAVDSDSTTLNVESKENGSTGNSTTTTVVTGANISWGNSTLTGGGSGTFEQVSVPDNVGVVDVGHVNGYVIVVIAQGYGVNGRFYWIEPGEKIIRPLNFATAERAPDPLWSVRVTGDQFWLPGTSTTEVWYPTGNLDAPFQRIQGRLFDRGIWGGTDVQIRNTVVLVDQDGIAYAITDAPRRISNSGIEERIRRAMAEQERHI